MARPTTWHKKISASKEALAFYEALVIAHEAGAFNECHVYSGALDRKGNPIVGAKNSSTTAPLSQVVAGFLGLRINGRRNCGTPGCMNPLHYQEPGPGDTANSEKEWEAKQPQRTVEELKEAVEFLRDRKDITGPKPLSFYRQIFEVEDMSDLELQRVWEVLPSSWKEQ